MNIAEEVFKRTKFDIESLISYGFQKQENSYLFTKNILDNAFCVEVKIEKNLITCKVIDLAFKEEYTGYKREGEIGAFAKKVKDEVLAILEDIKNHCTKIESFISNQANRIASLIKEKYGDTPEFVWNKFPGYGLFRNPKNKKWYGLIANIDKSKLTDETGEVEILNVKLNAEKIPFLLKQKGLFKAYHMNKKNWISIILNDTLKDEEIMTYIEESHNFTNVNVKK